ncbi:chemotaxis protein CheW [Janthinobacterium aquaticum]|nr:chemotaxis protein CheW [Janthinobacterium sp. FT58W]
MKVLVFHIGNDRYGLPLADIVRVLPLLQLKQLPLTPDYVAGLMDLHGAHVPVIDLSRLAGLAPAATQFDTRIVVVNYRPAGGASHALGLMASRVRGIEQIDPARLTDSGVLSAPFLGQVASGSEGTLQLLQLQQLLSPEVRALLFPAGSAP